jgi:predicted nucleotidyltransferase component of viral defense system
MIPMASITEWTNTVPWTNLHHVEQDLIISRALVAIYQDTFLASKLAFRGGTAIHKLFLSPQKRYSEDIDLVQIDAEPIGPILNHIREVLAFLGEPRIKQKMSNNVLLYQYENEVLPKVRNKLKIEINCKEHFFVFPRIQIPFEVQSTWFSGTANLLTYQFDELIGTKIRALYQRKKGRDLFDLYCAIESGKLNIEAVIECYKKYISLNPYKYSTYLKIMDCPVGRYVQY